MQTIYESGQIVPEYTNADMFIYIVAIVMLIAFFIIGIKLFNIDEQP